MFTIPISKIISGRGCAPRTIGKGLGSMYCAMYIYIYIHIKRLLRDLLKSVAE